MTDLLIRILFFLGGRLAEALIRKYSLPLALSFVGKWTHFYTGFAPECEREDRREEMHLDLYLHVTFFEAQGLGESEIALHVLARMIVGAKDDVAWVAPHLPGAIASRLERGSEYLEELGAPRPAISFLAAVILMTSGIVMSSDDLWRELPIFFASMFMCGFITLYARRPSFRGFRMWGERILSVAVAIGSIFVAVSLSWVGVQYRLYENPLLYQILVAALPISFCVIIATRKYRSLLFSGRWAPVFASWILIAMASIGAVLKLSDDPNLWITIWLYMLGLPFTFFLMIGTCLIVAKTLWRGGVKLSVSAMRMGASSLRNLE